METVAQELQRRGVKSIWHMDDDAFIEMVRSRNFKRTMLSQSSSTDPHYPVGRPSAFSFLQYMDWGDSRTVTAKTGQHVRAVAGYWAKKTGFKYTVKKVGNNQYNVTRFL